MIEKRDFMTEKRLTGIRTGREPGTVSLGTRMEASGLCFRKVAVVSIENGLGEIGWNSNCL